MYIHAFDPGESTGSCVLTASKEEGIVVVTTDVLTTYRDFADITSYFRTQNKPNIVVIEAWRLFPHKAQSQIGSYMPAAEKIGIIKYLCWLYNIEWVEQMASCKKAFEEPRVVAQVLQGFVLPKSPHERDALSHALYYWFNTGRHLK